MEKRRGFGEGEVKGMTRDEMIVEIKSRMTEEAYADYIVNLLHPNGNDERELFYWMVLKIGADNVLNEMVEITMEGME